MSHKIFHPGQWKDINKLQVVSNHLAYQSNWNSIQNYIKGPVIVIGTIIYLGDYTLLRLGIQLNRIYLIAGAIGILPSSMLLDHYGGKHPSVIKLVNFIVQAMRLHNDTEMDHHLKMVKEHDILFKDMHRIIKDLEEKHASQ